MRGLHHGARSIRAHGCGGQIFSWSAAFPLEYTHTEQSEHRLESAKISERRATRRRCKANAPLQPTSATIEKSSNQKGTLTTRARNLYQQRRLPERCAPLRAQMLQPAHAHGTLRYEPRAPDTHPDQPFLQHRTGNIRSGFGLIYVVKHAEFISRITVNNFLPHISRGFRASRRIGDPKKSLHAPRARYT